MRKLLNEKDPPEEEILDPEILKTKEQIKNMEKNVRVFET